MKRLLLLLALLLACVPFAALAETAEGTPLLPEGMVLMEVKTSGAMPLWMTKHLSEKRIFKTSFSKYGTAYQTMIFNRNKGVYLHA